MDAKKISQVCVVCGKTLSIRVNKDRSYDGGHFFGKLELGKDNRRKKVEYWECYMCYSKTK